MLTVIKTGLEKYCSIKTSHTGVNNMWILVLGQLPPGQLPPDNYPRTITPLGQIPPGQLPPPPDNGISKKIQVSTKVVHGYGKLWSFGGF